MSTTARVVARNVSKMFHRVHEPPMLLREAFFLMASRPKRAEEFWALHDISFEVADGETMGVLGRNGSGKSTLLQVVGGSSFPTEGTISTRGRIATLLALGAGLRGDMTGEENIIMNAGFLGLSADEIKERMPKIVEFSELAHVIDTPVRHYSSGMNARLGFSIAINVSPDILIVDEVLSVGDMTFQGKSMEKILDMKQAGTTIVYASQNPNQVAEFCSRAIWLEEGEVRAAGAARDVAGEYTRAMQARAR